LQSDYIIKPFKINIMDSKQFINQADVVYQNALNAAIELLKQNGEKRYIAFPDFDDEVSTFTKDDVPIGIWGVGLNDDDHICVQAVVNNVGYGYTGEEFPVEEWVDITEEGIYPTSYPDLYRFVAEHLDSAMDKEAAEKIELE
jgi:hypothetical protein